MTKLTNQQKAIIRSMADHDMKVRRVAADLNYRDTTITYHCQKMKRVFGLDPRKFWDLVDLLDMAEGDGPDAEL